MPLIVQASNMPIELEAGNYTCEEVLQWSVKMSLPKKFETECMCQDAEVNPVKSEYEREEDFGSQARDVMGICFQASCL